MRIKYLIYFCISLCALSNVDAQQHTRGGAANDYITIYQKYLSNLKNTRCSMYPTCSNYSKMVFEDHSFPIAMILTSDRLIRCGNDLHLYPRLYGNSTQPAIDYPLDRRIPSSFCIHAPIPIAAESLPINDSLEQDICFTSYLINQKNYTNAWLEIDRLLFYNKEASTKPILYVNKLKCLEGLKLYNDGILFFEQAIPTSIKCDYKVLFEAAHLYDIIGDNNKSISLYEQAASCYDSTAVSPYGELAILYSKNSQLSAAKSSLLKKYLLDGDSSSYNSSIAIVNNLETTNYKKPIVAGILSVFPGGGYFYTKQPRNALSALIINAALAYATYTSFKTENYGVGFIVGVLNLSFYLGNISGSYNSARRYNNKLNQDAINNLRQYNQFIY